jgi:hypothetical protein
VTEIIGAPQQAPPPQYSPDGRWWWTGQQWVPIAVNPIAQPTGGPDSVAALPAQSAPLTALPAPPAADKKRASRPRKALTWVRSRPKASAAAALILIAGVAVGVTLSGGGSATKGSPVQAACRSWQTALRASGDFAANAKPALALAQQAANTDPAFKSFESQMTTAVTTSETADAAISASGLDGVTDEVKQELQDYQVAADSVAQTCAAEGVPLKRSDGAAWSS